MTSLTERTFSVLLEGIYTEILVPVLSLVTSKNGFKTHFEAILKRYQRLTNAQAGIHLRRCIEVMTHRAPTPRKCCAVLLSQREHEKCPASPG